MWHRTLILLTPTHPSTRAERPDFTDAIILRKGASVEHVVSETCLGQGWGAPPIPSHPLGVLSDVLRALGRPSATCSQALGMHSTTLL